MTYYNGIYFGTTCLVDIIYHSEV